MEEECFDYITKMVAEKQSKFIVEIYCSKIEVLCLRIKHLKISRCSRQKKIEIKKVNPTFYKNEDRPLVQRTCQREGEYNYKKFQTVLK